LKKNYIIKGDFKMNKNELISAVSEATELSKKDATAAVNATFDAISKAMAEGDKVQLIGFGTFETRERSAKTAKNPRTGEAVEVPACKAPAFKAGKALKELVNK
jgi:DNA-binding protein HU-beta